MVAWLWGFLAAKVTEEAGVFLGGYARFGFGATGRGKLRIENSE